MNGSLPEGRRYRVLDLIGRGGFGNVYRARLEGPAGFSKEVAIKIVRNEEVSSSEISRFRDEARILGLVRDRAIVGVDPPIRLGGRLALVMEYIDGTSCHRLLQVTPVPPRPALEIVQEIARALHKVYSLPGEDGQPLHLIHRDLKPANVQLTPEGDVKLLDFGIARARFRTRETRTSSTIGGTLGYIAPERLRGIEGPEGDIFSLGVLLHVLVTTERATRLDPVGQTEPGGSLAPVPEDRDAKFEVARTLDVERVIALSARMRHPDPAMRPTARAVEMDCAAIGASLSGQSLRQWSAEAVPNATIPLGTLSDALAGQEPDDLVGLLLTETVELSVGSIDRREPKLLAPSTDPVRAGALQWPVVRQWHWAAGAAGLLMVFMLMGTLAGVGTGFSLAAATWVWPGLGETLTVVRKEPAPAGEEAGDAAAIKLETEDLEAKEPEDAVGTAAEPMEAGPAAAEPAEPSPRKAPVPRPARNPVPPTPVPPTPAPVVAPIVPEVAEDPAVVEIVGVTFLSEPAGASIYLDGVLVGRTPLRDHPVSAGDYKLLLQLNGRKMEREVRLGGRRGSTSFNWRGEQLLVQ